MDERSAAFSAVCLDHRRLVGGRAPEFEPVAGVTGVGLGPPAGGVLREPLDRLRAVPAGDAPRRDPVGEVTRVALVVERELLDGPIADAEIVELVPQIPLSAAPLAGDRRGVVDVGRGRRAGVSVRRR